MSIGRILHYEKVCYETGKPAITNWRRVRADQNESRLKLNPKTGRSHQLRVHCMAMGHVILGDPLYAEGEAVNYDRLMLHSEELRLNHPEWKRYVLSVKSAILVW